MAVPSDGITINYSWQLPAVGGDIGSWGGILNTVFGWELTPAELVVHETTPATPPPGIDQIVGLIRTDLTTAEAAISDLGDDVQVLEDTVAPSFYARVALTSSQTIPLNSAAFTIITWDAAALFDEGTVYDTATRQRMAVPTDAEGAWQIRAHVTMPSWKGQDDDANSWRVQIVRTDGATPTVIAEARSIYANDGFDSDSGDLSLSVTALAKINTAEIAAGVYFTVGVRLFQPDTSATTQPVRGSAYKTFFEAVRVAPEEIAEA